METEVLEKIEKIEKDLLSLKGMVSEQIKKRVWEETEALKAVKIYQKEKRAGKLFLLKDPKELLD